MFQEQNNRDGFKILTMVGAGLPTRPSIEDEKNDKSIRFSLYERTLNSDMLNEQMMAQAPPAWRRWIYKRLPYAVSQVIEAYIIRRRYDVIVSWGERVGLLFALMLKITHKRFPHIAMMYSISKPKTAIPLKHVNSHITSLILWNSANRDFAINHLKIPPDKIKLIPYSVDHKFYRPMPVETDMICSAGREKRDYPTLVEAMRGLEIKCHIAAPLNWRIYDEVKALYEQTLPPNVTVGPKSPQTELRALYARSRFVVMPLLPGGSDSGLTVILEAMAMGKAVICTRMKENGKHDAIIEGKTGVFVPYADPVALRDAIEYLWNHPEIAEKMGREGRKRIEEEFAWDQFVSTVKKITQDAINEVALATRRKESGITSSSLNK